MRGLKVMLFGIAVICFSGFLVVGEAVGSPILSPLYCGMLLGLALCFVGLLMDDGGNEGAAGGADATDAEDGEGTEETDADDEEDSIINRDYSDSRSPRM